MPELSFDILHAGPGNAGAVAELLTAVFRTPLDPVLDDLRGRGMLDAELVAVSGGKVVGYAAAAAAVAEQEPGRLLSDVFLLAVDEDFQGLGAGRKLVWALIDRLRKRGHLAVFTAGLHAYAAHFGFHSLGTGQLTAGVPGPLLALELVDGGLAGLSGTLRLQENPWRR